MKHETMDELAAKLEQAAQDVRAIAAGDPYMSTRSLAQHIRYLADQVEQMR